MTMTKATFTIGSIFGCDLVCSATHLAIGSNILEKRFFLCQSARSRLDETMRVIRFRFLASLLAHSLQRWCILNQIVHCTGCPPIPSPRIQESSDVWLRSSRLVLELVFPPQVKGGGQLLCSQLAKGKAYFMGGHPPALGIFE